MHANSRASLWKCFGCIFDLWYALMMTFPPVSRHTPLRTVEMLWVTTGVQGFKGWAVARVEAQAGKVAADVCLACGHRGKQRLLAACRSWGDVMLTHLPRYSSTFWLNWLMDSYLMRACGAACGGAAAACAAASAASTWRRRTRT